MCRSSSFSSWGWFFGSFRHKNDGALHIATKSLMALMMVQSWFASV
jgi:hypothetical protein